MEDAEKALTVVEDEIGVEAAAILNTDGGIVISHMPEEEQDVIQSLLFSLGGVAVSSFVAEMGGKVLGLKKADSFILAVLDRGDAGEVHVKLEKGVALLSKLIKREKGGEGVREDLLEAAKPSSVPRLTSAVRRIAMEMKVPAEYVAFFVPTRKIFTLEFMESKVSREMAEKYGGWVMDLFMMIDGEKSVKTLADMLGRDINEVIMAVGELVKAKAVTVRRIDISPMSGPPFES
ncbi:MAG: hypothetical protein KIH01_05360 [Candidatus Freyarchaeota archaeon]|nr:hypothetical protein [Candidatus Jordarchaeia archaeon]